MYNKFNYLNDEWYKSLRGGMQNNMDGIKNNPNLTTPSEGYNRGNLFENLYDQYKNYRPVTLKANNDKERLFLEMSRMAFAAHELNLYLDLKPNDASMIALFNDYRRRADQLTREYESKYGPLNIQSDALDQVPFMWEKDKWPWEGYNV